MIRKSLSSILITKEMWNRTGKKKTLEKVTYVLSISWTPDKTANGDKLYFPKDSRSFARHPDLELEKNWKFQLDVIISNNTSFL